MDIAKDAGASVEAVLAPAAIGAIVVKLGRELRE